MTLTDSSSDHYYHRHHHHDLRSEICQDATQLSSAALSAAKSLILCIPRPTIKTSSSTSFTSRRDGGGECAPAAQPTPTSRVLPIAESCPNSPVSRGREKKITVVKLLFFFSFA